MKTITVKNPEQRLREVMVHPTEKWVQTCHSGNCGCVSHDSGYFLVTGEVPDEVKTAEVGGTVHSHARTIRVDDAEGRCREHVAALVRRLEADSPGRHWSDAGREAYEATALQLAIARKALEFIRAGHNPHAAYEMAEEDCREEQAASSAEGRRP